MSRLVFIASIPRATATGISDWVAGASGQKMRKNKVGRAADYIMALPSRKLGGLANYISYNYVTNPNTGQVETDEQGNPITLQAHLEKKWGKPAGFFSNQLAPPNYKGDPEKLGYFYNKTWMLSDGSTVLDLDTMDGELGYYVMLASSRIANSEKEWREHKWPKATHYIALENESATIKYQRTKAKSKAFKTLEELVDTTKAKLATLLDISSAKTILSPEQLHNLLFEYLEGSMANVEKFLNFTTLLKSADGKAKFETMYILKQAQDLRIIYAKQDVWTWIRPNGATLVIGDRYSEAIDFLMNPKKADEYAELTEQIKSKS